MDVDQLVEQHPRLRHVTTAGAWSEIADSGQLSASALLGRNDPPSELARPSGSLP